MGHITALFKTSAQRCCTALKNRSVTITPFIGAIVPSHHYRYFNHAAVGRRLFEVEAGAGFARFLDPVLPDAYVQARYSFGMPQKVLDISHNHSQLSVEAGYLIKRSLQVFVNAAGEYTHGGIDFGPAPRREVSWETYTHHDQIAREHHLLAEAGTAFSIADSTNVFASVVRAIAGHNGHKIDYLWSVGISKSFDKASGQRTSVGRRK